MLASAAHVIKAAVPLGTLVKEWLKKKYLMIRKTNMIFISLRKNPKLV